MDNVALLKPKLSRLKLSGILETMEYRISQAINERWEYSQFLLMLCTDEIYRRDAKQLCRRISKSSLHPEKTLETFDFRFNPEINPLLIKELATCGFIRTYENIFFVGPSGVGKSHLAQAIGHEACRRGFDVLHYNTYSLFKWIRSGHGDGTYDRRLNQIISVPVLILDDFGLRELSEQNQFDLYEVIQYRYEKSSTIITSNRDCSEWPSVFSNQLMGSAAMDRLVHHGKKIVIKGNSYRVAGKEQKTKSAEITIDEKKEQE
jgi:DNA replication protein DnaC